MLEAGDAAVDQADGQVDAAADRGDGEGGQRAGGEQPGRRDGADQMATPPRFPATFSIRRLKLT